MSRGLRNLLRRCEMRGQLVRVGRRVCGGRVFHMAGSAFSTEVPVASVVAHESPSNVMNASEDASARFAVFPLSGRQYKVTLDDTIVADNMQEVDIDSHVTVQNVLMVGSKDTTIIGRPYVPGATVTMRVEELAKDKKVHALKFRRRKNSQRLRGFRRQVTILRVTDIDLNTAGRATQDDTTGEAA